MRAPSRKPSGNIEPTLSSAPAAYSRVRRTAPKHCDAKDHKPTGAVRTVDEANRRVTLLAAVLTGQAAISLGALLVGLLGGLDALLFLAPVDWGLGFLVNRNGALGIAALLYLLGTATFATAAGKLRNGDPGARRWIFLAAVAGFTQMPTGVVCAAYGLWIVKCEDFAEHLQIAPVLSGRGLQRLVVAWLLASSIAVIAGAASVALLFGPTVPFGLLGMLAATMPQAGLLRILHKRIQDDGQLLPALPPLPPSPMPSAPAPTIPAPPGTSPDRSQES